MCDVKQSLRCVVGWGLSVSLGLAVCLPAQAVSPDLARAELGKLQQRVRTLLEQGSQHAANCDRAKAGRKAADDDLLAADVANDVDFAKMTRAAQRAQQQEGADCALKTMHEDRLDVARGLLRQAAIAFEHCRTDEKPEDKAAACERTETLASDVARAGASGDKAASVIAAAQTAQGSATQLKKDAEKAFETGDKAVGRALAEYDKHPTAETAKVLQAAQRSRERSLDVYDASQHVQTIANQLAADGLALAKCKAQTPPCPEDDPEVKLRVERGLALADDMAQRKSDSKRAFSETKLAAFTIEPAVLRAPDNQKDDALAFLKLIDSNPDVSSLFGGEAIRLSAGKKGGEASIRVDLDRFVSNPTKDFSLILTAPVGEGSSTALYDSGDGVTSGATATLAYRFLPRLLKEGRLLPYLYQFGVQASLGYAAHSYRSADDITQTMKKRSKPWSLGGQVIYANTKATLLHQLGVNYKVETSYADGVTKLTRCPLVPTGQTSAACVNAYFQPPEQRAGWELSYNVRFKAGGAALSPSFTYDRRTNVKSYELPIYLIGDVEKKSLTAGVSLLHSSSGKDDIAAKSAIRLFVSSPFSLFGD
ncbi:hypothetical protein [Roseateles sp. P5_E7]